MVWRLLWPLLLAAALILSAPARAQEPAQPDYAAWEKVAEQAEAVVAEGTARESQLSEIRAQMVSWRERFTAAQSLNDPRIAALRDQIAALGPAPAEGETEAEDVAARRKALNEELSALQAPRIAAVEAYSRADAVVRGIDGLIRERQTRELLRLTPSPLNPANWHKAASEGFALLAGIAGETSDRRDRLSALGDKLPVVAAYLLAALVLLTYGRIWIDSLPRRLSAHASAHSRAVLAFVVSLGQIAIPLIGIYLGISAIDATGLLGDWTSPFLVTLPVAGLILFGGRWIARQVFPVRPIAYETVRVPAERRNPLRWMLTGLAALMALQYVLAEALLPLSGFLDPGDTGERVPMRFDEGAAGVWHLLLIAPAALLLFRLGNILRRLRDWDAGETPLYRVRILSGAGSLSRIVAAVALLLTLIGLVSAANALIWPWTMTLGLILLLILLQDFTADLFEMFTRGQEGAREGLAPLLIGFGLVLLSAPLFALIWGARGADIAEAWVRLRQGVTFGGIRLSPGAVLTFLVVFALGYMVTRFVQGAFRNTILPKTRIDPGGQSALVSGLGYVGVFIAALLAITSAGIDLSSFAIVAGALSVGIGFGLQNIVSNFVSGIILLIERPISVGDWISAGGQQGIVKRVSVRSTHVETFDRTEVIVPNTDLVTQPVVNWTRSNKSGRIIIPVGVAYGTDTRAVEAILREIIEDQPLVAIDPAPLVLLTGLGPDSLNFEIRAILSDVSAGMGVTSDVLHQIVARFGEAGIEIPFVQRDIWLRNPEALRTGAEGGPSPAERREAGPTTPPAEPGQAPAPRDPGARPAAASPIDPRLTDLPDAAGDPDEA